MLQLACAVPLHTGLLFVLLPRRCWAYSLFSLTLRVAVHEGSCRSTGVHGFGNRPCLGRPHILSLGAGEPQTMSRPQRPDGLELLKLRTRLPRTCTGQDLQPTANDMWSRINVYAWSGVLWRWSRPWDGLHHRASCRYHSVFVLCSIKPLHVTRAAARLEAISRVCTEILTPTLARLP